MTDLPAADPDTLKLGMLLEAAQSHQELADDSLKRLQAHTQGLDGVVRDEIRRALIAELGDLVEHLNRAAYSLRALSRVAQLRTVWCGAVLSACPALVVSLLVWWWLPSGDQISKLRIQQQQFADNLEYLRRNGAQIDLRHCGNPARLCVRVDRQAGAFGQQADYLIVQGY
ncbi:MAG TPA: hypothetical protein VNZ06_14850 [Steroidobacteraceae bacterium]|nr:hypothetical protein [Steroidobacteraceae bacterium]